MKIKYKDYVITDYHWKDRFSNSMSKHFILDENGELVHQEKTIEAAIDWVNQKTGEGENGPV